MTTEEAGEITAFDRFARRHIGPQPDEVAAMLQALGLTSLEQLVERTVPAGIRIKSQLKLAPARSEFEMLEQLRRTAEQNRVFRSYIGLGFSDCITPGVIQRNILENPGWYTQYTPYQAEIAQGRLEALLNFQTMITDLTGMDIANASLLDEGSAAAEGMMLCLRAKGGEGRKRFFVSSDVHPPTRDVVITRALPLGVEVVEGEWQKAALDATYFGALVQYPTTNGEICDYRAFTERVHKADIAVIAAADLLALTLLTPPGEWGADLVIGSSQRFGVPLCYGGPHAAFMATKDEYKRAMPGRLIGVSKDATGRPALRLALQTREQHIKRDRATSNICTAQVLLAVMASMYAVYHGPRGLRRIAERVHALTCALEASLTSLGFPSRYRQYFDTLRVETKRQTVGEIRRRAEEAGINLRYFDDGTLGISLDETTRIQDVEDIIEVVTGGRAQVVRHLAQGKHAFDKAFARKSSYLTHPVFNSYHSETEMLRYIHRLEARDLSLNVSMIPLGSCTMKLNATAEMVPVTWPEFARLHPFAPAEQARGYATMIGELERQLCEVTGFDAFSLQPNAGSQGEYAGLLVIRAYHESRNEGHRNICLIPESAHGTNPASAVMAGMNVVAVKCDKQGNVDVADLRQKAAAHSANLAALMVTYPSTHGVFEEAIVEICRIVHEHGGQVYMDGANLNAQVGLCRPGDFGVDVSHTNLHKTFCIPHGGGGPGVGPIGVKAHLAPFLPGHALAKVGGERAIGPVTSAPWGSAGILAIPYMYISMMGADGLAEATKVAILNANYVAYRLQEHYPVLYRGAQGMVAHECILDVREIKKSSGVDAGDIAKRLMDYGFHAPTVSFPVVDTLMVEPTESESKAELDRFCEAMIAIREEIREIERGKADRANNVVKNAPHTAEMITADEWTFPYSRQRAAYPLASVRERKFWPSTARIDNTYGDRNLFCSCVPMEAA